MKTEDILKIVEDTFDNHILAEGWLETVSSSERAYIKESFMKSVADKLKDLFKSNGLSK